MGSRNATQRTAVDSYLASETHLLPQVAEHLFAVLHEIVWRWGIPAARIALRPAIASVVPYYHIYVFLQEEPQIVSMREVYHVLVKHGIRVAQYERRQSFVAHSWVFVIDCFACCREKHGVYLSSPRLIWLDPPMLSLECFLQNHAHLLCLTEYRSEAAVAIKALSRTAEAA